MKLKMHTRDPGKGLGCGAAIFFLVFLLMGLLFTFWMAQDIWQKAATRSWVQTPCMITRSEVGEDRAASEPYVPQVAYQYQMGGREYQATRVARADLSSSDYADAARVVAHYHAGTPAVCFVNPENPAEAVLQHAQLADMLFILIPLVFVAVGAGGIYMGLRKKKAPEQQPLSSARRTGKHGQHLVALLFFAVFFAVGVGTGYALVFKPWARALAARQSWMKLPCQIISSRVQSHDSDDGTTYRVDILYQYEVDGIAYKSSAYNFWRISSSGYQAKRDIVNQYPPGAQAMCHVNPADPRDAVLHPGPAGAERWLGLIPLVFALVGLGGLVGTWRAMARTKATPSLTEPGIRSSGPLILTPRNTPVAKLAVAVGIAAFWNGIVSVFVVQLIEEYTAGAFPIGLTLFLLPFVAIGLGLLGMVGYQVLALRNPRPRLTLDQAGLTPGQKYRLAWQMAGDVRRLSRLSICLVGREIATYRRGTSTAKDEHKFYTRELFASERVNDMEAGVVDLELPRRAMHSFKSDNNQIEWFIQVDGRIARWPDLKAEFVVEVLPGTKEAA